MFNATTLLSDALGRHLAETYQRIYGGRAPEYGRILDSAAKLVIEQIANSDALYHAAVTAHLRGDNAAALGWLGRAVRAGYAASNVDRDPEWKALRTTLEFHNALK